MKIDSVIFFFLSLCGLRICSMEQDWNMLFDQYKDILQELPLVRQQYKMCGEGNAFLLAGNSMIDQETSEPLEDLNIVTQWSNKQLYMMPKPDYPLQGIDYNSGLPDNSKMQKTLLCALKRMPFYLNKYAERFGYKSKAIHVTVFGALATLQTDLKREFIQYTPLHLKLSGMQIEELTERFTQIHTRDYLLAHADGNTADIRLWDTEKKIYLDMGDFCLFNQNKQEASTFCDHISFAQKKNRLYCLIAACKAGLIPYPNAFWQYTTHKQLAAFWAEKTTEKMLVRSQSYLIIPSAHEQIKSIRITH